MFTVHLSPAKRPTGQPAMVNGGKFGGRMVHIVPEKYLEEGFRLIEDQEFGIQLVIRKEELNFL